MNIKETFTWRHNIAGDSVFKRTISEVADIVSRSISTLPPTESPMFAQVAPLDLDTINIEIHSWSLRSAAHNGWLNEGGIREISKKATGSVIEK